MSFEPGLAVGDFVSFFVNLASKQRKDEDSSLNPSYGAAIGKVIQIMEGGSQRAIWIGVDEENKNKAARQGYYFDNVGQIVATAIGNAGPETIPPVKIFHEPRALLSVAMNKTNRFPFAIKIVETVPNAEGELIVNKIPSPLSNNGKDPNPFAAGGGSSSSSAAAGGSKLRRTRRRSTRRSTRLRTNRR